MFNFWKRTSLLQAAKLFALQTPNVVHKDLKIAQFIFWIALRNGPNGLKSI